MRDGNGAFKTVVADLESRPFGIDRGRSADRESDASCRVGPAWLRL